MGVKHASTVWQDDRLPYDAREMEEGFFRCRVLLMRAGSATVVEEEGKGVVVGCAPLVHFTGYMFPGVADSLAGALPQIRVWGAGGRVGGWVGGGVNRTRKETRR